MKTRCQLQTLHKHGSEGLTEATVWQSTATEPFRLEMQALEPSKQKSSDRRAPLDTASHAHSSRGRIRSVRFLTPKGSTANV